MKTLKIKNQTIIYKSSGLVYGKYWGGGEGSYTATKLQSNNLKDLKKLINDNLKSGGLDSGMGYESLLGCLLDIEIFETIETNNGVYYKSENELCFFGNLTEDQMNFLEENIYNY